MRTNLSLILLRGAFVTCMLRGASTNISTSALRLLNHKLPQSVDCLTQIICVFNVLHFSASVTLQKLKRHCRAIWRNYRCLKYDNRCKLVENFVKNLGIKIFARAFTTLMTISSGATSCHVITWRVTNSSDMPPPPRRHVMWHVNTSPLLQQISPDLTKVLGHSVGFLWGERREYNENKNQAYIDARSIIISSSKFQHSPNSPLCSDIIFW